MARYLGIIYGTAANNLWEWQKGTQSQVLALWLSDASQSSTQDSVEQCQKNSCLIIVLYSLYNNYRTHMIICCIWEIHMIVWGFNMF